jgi:hypothetical protein
VTKTVWGIALASSIFAGSILTRAIIVRAEDAPTTEPAKHAGLRVEKPYSEISNLTDDEKSKIAELHRKSLEEIKAIREKETDDIRAVLTDDQKTQLDKIIAETRDKREAKMKEKKAAATEPAGG